MIIKSKYKNYKVFFSPNIPSLKKTSNRIFLIDKNVKIKFYNKIKINECIIINANEFAKDFTNIHKIILKIKKLNGNKKTELHVIGGGVLQDLGSFIASIYMRGIKWIFYPTTLLAQADSCIGSKTSINLINNKNLLGNFYPPTKIQIHKKFLTSLTKSEIHSGYGEIIKYFLLQNFNKKIKYEKFNKELFEQKKIDKLTIESLKIKKKYIEQDEFDQNIRKHLNYGHTFGHAIETATNYKIPHGIAITFGMDFANFLSQQLKKISLNDYEMANKILRKNFYKFENFKISKNKMIEALKNDKKNHKKNKLTCILKTSQFHLVDLEMNKKFQSYLTRYHHLRFV